ncbi:hypothetical protein [Teichococcus aerofrigidensis]
MAFIMGPAAGGATLAGTGANDVLVARGGGNLIIGGGGEDDVITSWRGMDTVRLGEPGDGDSGRDTVLLAGKGNGVIAGDAGLDLLSWGGGNTVSLGNGDNRLEFWGRHNSVSTGFGDNDILFHCGGNSVLLDGGLYPGSAGETWVRFAGTGNSFSLAESAFAPPPTVNLRIEGGAGQGSFDLGGLGTASLDTGGTGNRIFLGLGDYAIQPGAGDSLVSFPPSGRGAAAGEVSITLEGYGDRISGAAGHLEVQGGTGGTRVELLGFTANDVDLRLGGEGNSVTSQTLVEGHIASAGGRAQYDIFGVAAEIVLAGADNRLQLDTLIGGRIVDGGEATRIDISYSNTLYDFSGSILDFGASRGGVVALDDGTTGYASVAAVLAALESDGAGGSLLAIGGGALHFEGLAPAALAAANFAII